MTFSVEELLAMQFAHAKEQAETAAQETVKDVVITVRLTFFCTCCWVAL
jgi:molecular chaperone DnaK (HSP70)